MRQRNRLSGAGQPMYGGFLQLWCVPSDGSSQRDAMRRRQRLYHQRRVHCSNAFRNCIHNAVCYTYTIVQLDWHWYADSVHISFPNAIQHTFCIVVCIAHRHAKCIDHCVCIADAKHFTIGELHAFSVCVHHLHCVCIADAKQFTIGELYAFSVCVHHIDRVGIPQWHCKPDYFAHPIQDAITFAKPDANPSSFIFGCH